MTGTTIEVTVTVELGDTDMVRFIHYANVVEHFDVGFRNVLEAAGLSFHRCSTGDSASRSCASRVTTSIRCTTGTN